MCTYMSIYYMLSHILERNKKNSSTYKVCRPTVVYNRLAWVPNYKWLALIENTIKFSLTELFKLQLTTGGGRAYVYLNLY